MTSQEKKKNSHVWDTLSFNNLIFGDKMHPIAIKYFVTCLSKKNVLTWCRKLEISLNAKNNAI